MINLSTEYMGMKLRNPLIVASSGLTDSLEGVRRCEDAGAGAVVLKSLFEEQIQIETNKLEQHIGPSWHAEAFDYVKQMGMRLGPNDYLKFIEETKKTAAIPVIASLNCISPVWWSDYAKQIEAAGADAIELNISFMPSNPQHSGKDIEQQYLHSIDKIRNRIKKPIAVKIGPYFTSTAQMAEQLYAHGASALVLFNRFYQFDINIDTLELSPGHSLSTPEEIHTSLRWVALLSGRIKCDLAAATGIHDASGVIKQILAGATVVQICSTLYKNGLEQIDKILEEIKDWMKTKHFDSIHNFRGKLNQMQSDQPELYERLQYIKGLTGIE